MNMKENVLFLRNEWTATGEVDKTDRTELGKCIHLYDVTKGNKEKFNCRGWCVELSAVHKVFGLPKFPQQSEWTNFPHATLCVWLSEMMAKSFWRHYDINNLTQDYRKEKEESKETMALEVATDGKNDKTEKND